MSLKRKLELRNFSKSKKKDVSAIHPTLFKLVRDHPLNLKLVNECIDYNKVLAIQFGVMSRQKKIGEDERIWAKNKERDHKTYVKECEHYKKTGDWISNFYGKDQEYKIKWKSNIQKGE